MTIKKFIGKISYLLDKSEIDYAVTGGVAVSVWGRPRYTADVDIVIEISSSDKIEIFIDLVQKEFKNIYADKEMALDAFKRKSEFNLIESEYGLKADFFVVRLNEYERERIKRALKKKIGQKMVNFVSPEDLIISKLLWYKKSQSTRHLEDIQSVLDIQKKIDRPYLTAWIRKIDLNKEWGALGKLKK